MKTKKQRYKHYGKEEKENLKASKIKLKLLEADKCGQHTIQKLHTQHQELMNLKQQEWKDESRLE